MLKQTKPQRTVQYHPYVLHFWYGPDAGRIGWRVVLEDTFTGRRVGFTDLEALVAFLQAQAKDHSHRMEASKSLLNGSDLILDAFPYTWQARANMSNWHITIQSTDFSDGLGDFISAAGFTVTMANSDIARVTGTAAPSSQVSASNVAMDTPVTLISATGGAGIGVYNFTPHFTLLVPGSTVAGSYAATVTVTIASGP